MAFSPLDSVTIDGRELKRKIVSGVSDGDAYRTAARNPLKYRVPNDDFRPNLLKARDDTLRGKLASCNSTDHWVRDILKKWSDISGLPHTEADFWREPGFMDAVKNGRDLQIRRYLDEEGWAWVVIRDIPSHWLRKNRLPETSRLKMLELQDKKKELSKKWWW